MNINIPDSLHKFLVLIGIICIAVGGYVDKELLENYYSKFDEFDEIQDSATLESYIVGLVEQDLVKRASRLSNRYKVNNPIIDQDSILVFNQILSGNKDDVIVSDSIGLYWENYLKQKEKLKILEKRKEINLKNIKDEEEILDSSRKFYKEVLIFGIVVFSVGFVAWAFDDQSSSGNILKQSEKVYRYCQSCGHDFTSFRPYGTEKNKTKNFALCIECYKIGKLKEPNLSKEEFFERKRKEIKSVNWISRILLMRRFKRLERWSKDYH